MQATATDHSAGLQSLSIGQTARETLESIVVAVILAFLFRGFVAEAFVIPTGSMAPTLQGRHMDVLCPECRFQYRSGASIENAEMGPPRGEVTSTRCPICRYTLQLDKENNFNHRSFNGDRILVSKFAYQFREPQRWDVIVFKYPGNAKINYIKRLVGLPGETIRIQHGDIHIVDPDTAEEPEARQRFRIERKSPEKILAMLQVVDDSRYTSPRLKQAGWPDRWIPTTTDGWQSSKTGFSLPANPATSWLRYRHLVPSTYDWRAIDRGEPVQPDPGYQGQLITDYYAYNDKLSQLDDQGEYWVGDLALECEVELRGGDGDLMLDLVEGGIHYTCTLSTESGQARLAIHHGRGSFTDAAGNATTHPAARTKVRRPGTYRLRFANIDDQLHLWVDDRLVYFDAPTTFQAPAGLSPKWSDQDAGDLQPVGVAARGLELHVPYLRVLRDVYYRAVQSEEGWGSEYAQRIHRSRDDIDMILSHPQQWEETDLFAQRRTVTFRLGPDQFFPLGDNSPESKDARLWSAEDPVTGEADPPHYVERDLLIGRALAIYWPHGWRIVTPRVGVIPNFQRIGLIR